MMGGFGYGYGMGGLSWLWMGMGMLLNFLLPLAVIGLIIYLLARKRNLVDNDKHYGDRSVQILQERYARGEISREEYLSMRREIER